MNKTYGRVTNPLLKKHVHLRDRSDFHLKESSFKGKIGFFRGGIHLKWLMIISIKCLNPNQNIPVLSDTQFHHWITEIASDHFDNEDRGQLAQPRTIFSFLFYFKSQLSNQSFSALSLKAISPNSNDLKSSAMLEKEETF